MKRSFAACTLTLALTLGLAGSAWAADSAASKIPAAANVQADPNAATAPTLPAFLAQLAPAAPTKLGVQIGTPTPIYATCPGIVYCRNFCTDEGGPNCAYIYHCYINGTWSCQCVGPGGGFCD
jgi:hypothetical protein